MKNYEDENFDDVGLKDLENITKNLSNTAKKLPKAASILIFVVVGVVIILVGNVVEVVFEGIKAAVTDNIDHIRDGLVGDGTKIEDIVDKNGNRLFDDDGNDIFSNDAGTYLDFLNEYGEKYGYSDEEYIMMDNSTVKRVLKAVDDENERLKNKNDLSYEYKIETGSFAKEYDPVTGEDIGEELYEIFEDVEYTKVEFVQQKVEEKNIVKTGNAMLDALIEKQAKKTGGYIVVREESTYTEQELIEKNEIINIGYKQVSVTDMDEDITNALGGVAYSVGYMRWQPVLAFSSLYIQCHFDNYDNTVPSSTNSEKYITDGMIGSILKLFKMNTVFAGDKILNESDLKYNYIENVGYGYRLTVTFENVLEKNQVKKIIREPVLLPRRVSNAFCSFEYDYEPVEDHPGYYRLKSRTITYQAKKFNDEMGRLLDTDEDMTKLFIELLKIQPHTEDLVPFYENLLLSGNSSDVVTYTTEDPNECSLIGCYIRSDTNPNLIGMDQSFVGGSGFTIPIYNYKSDSRELFVGEEILVPGQEYGELWISDYACRSVLVSDGYTKEEIRAIIDAGLEGKKGFKFNSDLDIFSSEEMIDAFVQCLYDLQNEYNISIAGLLAINVQEGGLNTCAYAAYYNYFSDTDLDTKVNRFSDVKTALQNGEIERKYSHIVNGVEDGFYDPVNGYYYTAQSIYQRFFARDLEKSGIRQDTYYSMVFTGYNMDDPEHAYDNLYHPYCPPYDDYAMPFSSESWVYNSKGEQTYPWNGSGGGWVNGCAYARRKIAYVVFGGDEKTEYMLEVARMCLGTPYHYSASWSIKANPLENPPKEFDCSSYVSWVFQVSGYHPFGGRIDAESIRQRLKKDGYVEIEPGHERTGDVYFLQGTQESKPWGVASHIGIVTEPGVMIHASSKEKNGHCVVENGYSTTSKYFFMILGFREDEE